MTANFADIIFEKKLYNIKCTYNSPLKSNEFLDLNMICSRSGAEVDMRLVELYNSPYLLIVFEGIKLQVARSGKINVCKIPNVDKYHKLDEIVSRIWATILKGGIIHEVEGKNSRKADGRAGKADNNTKPEACNSRAGTSDKKAEVSKSKH